MQRRTMGLLLVLCLIHPVVLDTTANLFRPGSESRALDDLAPSFAPRASALVAELRGEGWPVWVRATRRDRVRQEYFVQRGASQTLRSRHLRGTAMDLQLALPWVLLPLHIAFYHRLRVAAHSHGLCSGGDWRNARRGRLMALVGLGWDPAHVQQC